MAKQQKQTQISDYLQAKSVVETLGVYNEVSLVITNVGNFRKYLRDFSKYIDKQYVTRVLDGKLKITRLK